MGFFSKLLMLLLKVTKVTTGHQKLPKMGQNSIIISFFARRAKKASAEGQSPPQELEVSPRSGLYLLVVDKRWTIKEIKETIKLILPFKISSIIKQIQFGTEWVRSYGIFLCKLEIILLFKSPIF